MGEGQSKIASDGEESGGHHKGSGKSNASTQPNGGQTLQKDGESESAEQYGEKTEKFGTSTDADANKEVKAVDAGASKTHAKSGETQETEKANGVSGEAQDSTTDNTGTSERQEDSDKVEGKQEPSVGAQTGSQGHGSRDAGSNGDRSSPVSVNSATDSSDEMLAVLGTRRDGDSHLTRDRAQEGHDDELKGSAGEGMAGEGTEKQNSAVVVEASNEAEQPSSADVGGVNESVDAELRSQETSEMMGNKTDVSDTRAAESERKLEKNNQETGPVLVGAGKVQESAVESTEDADRASKSADNDVEKHGKSSETANGQETMKSETESAKPAPTDDAEKSNVRAKTPLLPNNHTPTASTPEGARPDAQQHLQPRAPKTKQPLVGSTPAEQANQNNIRTQTFDTPGRRSFRILMVSHVCGRLHLLNNLAEKSGAKAIVSCGNFGFFDAASYDNLPIHTLRKLLREQKGVLPEHKDKLLEFKEDRLREAMKEQNILSELHNYIQNDAGEAERRLHMPLYALWGANEDATVIDRIKEGTCIIPNLNILDEGTSHKINGVRLLGLGGDIVYDRLFDHGKAQGLVPGESGYIWSTMFQIVRLLQTARETFDKKETRIFCAYKSLGKEALIALLASHVNANFCVGGHVHAPYCATFTHWTTQDAASWGSWIETTITQVQDNWAQVQTDVEKCCSATVRESLESAMEVFQTVPSLDSMRALWGVVLCDLELGYAIANLKNHKLGLETISTGQDFSKRKKHANKRRAFERKLMANRALIAKLEQTMATTTANLNAHISNNMNRDKPPAAQPQNTPSAEQTQTPTPTQTQTTGDSGTPKADISIEDRDSTVLPNGDNEDVAGSNNSRKNKKNNTSSGQPNASTSTQAETSRSVEQTLNTQNDTGEGGETHADTDGVQTQAQQQPPQQQPQPQQHQPQQQQQRSAKEKTRNTPRSRKAIAADANGDGKSVKAVPSKNKNQTPSQAQPHTRTQPQPPRDARGDAKEGAEAAQAPAQEEEPPPVILTPSKAYVAFVKNIPSHYEQSNLTRIFKDCKVKHVSLNTSNGTAFVTVENAEMLEKALSINVQVSIGRFLVVSEARGKRPRIQSGGSRGGRKRSGGERSSIPVPCRYFASLGKCNKGNECRYLH